MATKGDDGMTGGLEVSVSVADGAWRRTLPRCREIARRAATAAAAREAAAAGPAEIAILLAGDARVRELNRRYRGIDSPTNVLAFTDCASPPPGAPRLLGDVVVAFGVARREADAAGLDISHHLSHLVVHGILHILGYDHEIEADARTMERREAAVLADLGVADPYAGRTREDARPLGEP